MSAVQGCPCLQTLVRNISGGAMHFSFLTYHGKTLADDETYLMDADIFDFSTRTMLGIRQRQALCCAITNGWMEIVYSPPDVGVCEGSSSSSPEAEESSSSVDISSSSSNEESSSSVDISSSSSVKAQ